MKQWVRRNRCKDAELNYIISDSQFIFFFTSWTGLISLARASFFWGTAPPPPPIRLRRAINRIKKERDDGSLQVTRVDEKYRNRSAFLDRK